jgi:hypothetical protein
MCGGNSDGDAGHGRSVGAMGAQGHRVLDDPRGGRQAEPVDGLQMRPALVGKRPRGRIIMPDDGLSDMNDVLLQGAGWRALQHQLGCGTDN